MKTKTKLASGVVLKSVEPQTQSGGACDSSGRRFPAVARTIVCHENAPIVYIGPIKFIGKRQVPEPIAFKYPLSKTHSGKVIPDLDHAAYCSRHHFSNQRLSYSGSVRFSDPKWGGQILLRTLPRYTEQDHIDAAKFHITACNAALKAWQTTQEKAHIATFGKKPETGYSSIWDTGDEKYAKRYKNKLRNFSRALKSHRCVAYAHDYAAGIKNKKPDEVYLPGRAVWRRGIG